MNALTLNELQVAGTVRSERWHAAEDGAAWSLLEWAGAMCGEAGEAANVAKKIRRLDGGLIGNEVAEHAITDRNELLAKLAGEIAGTIMYAERLATAAGLDLETIIIETFNRKSEALGFPDRLPIAASLHPTPQRIGDGNGYSDLERAALPPVAEALESQREVSG